jgi:hypothetical protein
MDGQEVTAALLRLHMKKREVEDMGIQCADERGAVKLHSIDFMVPEKEIIFFLHFLELRLLCLYVTLKHRLVAQHEMKQETQIRVNLCSTCLKMQKLLWRQDISVLCFGPSIFVLGRHLYVSMCGIPLAMRCSIPVAFRRYLVRITLVLVAWLSRSTYRYCSKNLVWRTTTILFLFTSSAVIHLQFKDIMTYLLEMRTVEPEKHPFLGNGSVTRNNEVTVGSGVSCEVRVKAI